jgi:hypothetical protein
MNVNENDWLNNLEYKALLELKHNMPTAFYALPQYMQDAFNERNKSLPQKG